MNDGAQVCGRRRLSVSIGRARLSTDGRNLTLLLYFFNEFVLGSSCRGTLVNLFIPVELVVMRVRWIVTSAVLAVTMLCWLLSHHSFRNNHKTIDSKSSDGNHLRDDFYLNRQSVTQLMEKWKETSDDDVEDVVRCFDRLSVQRRRRPMRIAFVGDSTVRNHFLTFLRVISFSFYLKYPISY